MSRKVDSAVKRIIEEIEHLVRPLDDDEYLDVMDEVASYCEISGSAKREQLAKE